MHEATIIIPAYNEEKSIQSVIRRVRAVSGKYEIIVVDDGSKDRTAELAEKEKATVVRLVKNSGKGFACLKGSEKASCENLVFIDADLQLKPEEIPKLISALKKCELAIGIRGMKNAPMQRRLANNIARNLISASTGMKISDALCGFRAVRKNALKKMELKQHRYEFESEMLLAAKKHGIKISEVPVTVSYHSYKGMGVMDSLKVLIFILKNRKIK